MEGKNKLGFVLFGFCILLVMSMPNVSAAWWNPFPCEDECFLGQLKCRPDGTSAWQCGDYDTLFEFDSCLEFPPESNQDAVQTCPFGCFVREAPTTDNPIGDTCLTGDPCAGIGCNPGDMRCGRKCKEGTSCSDAGSFVDASYMCKKITVGGTLFDCYGWSFDDNNAWECPFGCDWGSSDFPGSGMCLDQNQRDLSGCVKSIDECDASGFYVRECVDENFDGVYQLQDDPNDWTPCPNGCAQDFTIDGDAYCKDADGETDCNKCLFGGTRCNPNNDQYMQWCWESDLFGCSSWTNDYSRFVDKFGFGWHKDYGQYCDFGCHLGKCRANPEPDVPDIDACPFVGETRCAGDGSYVSFCETDPITGNLVWGNRKKCPSGKCVNGECVKSTGKGYETITEGIPNDLEIISTFGMAASGDNRLFYISALVNTGILTHTLITLTSNASYVSHCFLNETGAGVSGGLTSIGNNIYMMENATSVIKLDDACNNLSRIILDSNITLSLPFFASNETDLFIEGSNVSAEGFKVFKLDGAFQYSRCLIEPTFTFCRDNQFDVTHLAEKLYFLQPNTGSDDPPTLEIYGTDGYFFGNDSLEIPNGYSKDDLSGIAGIEDKLYLLWAKVTQTQPGPASEFRTDYLISVYFLDRACKNSCNEGGSRCVGMNKEFVSECIEIPDGCFKYYDEVNNQFPASFADDYMQNCGSTQCKEYWENHFILKAFCDEDISCENVCNASQYGCDSFRSTEEARSILSNDPIFEGLSVSDELASKYTGSKYRVKCILKDSPVPFNLGRQCFGWADPFDAMTDASNYEPCGQSHVCVDGQCVPASADCSLNESHCELKGDSQYVVPCDVIQNISRWSWGNRTFCQWGCVETFNSTDNKRIANCTTASIAQLTMSRQRNAVAEFEEYWNILWPDPFSQLIVILVLSAASFILLMPAGWQLASGASVAIIIGHLATGWLGGVFLFGILLLLGLFILPKLLSNKGEE